MSFVKIKKIVPRSVRSRISFSIENSLLGHARSEVYHYKVRNMFSLLNRRKAKKHRLSELGKKWKEFIKNAEFSTDWFDSNIDHWDRIFRSSGWYEKNPEILEIGSWEGRSTLFMLYYFPAGHITAIDTWMGGDEHKVRQLSANYNFSDIERRFDANTARFSDRLRKLKSFSTDGLSELKREGRKFDIVYIDGSHYADDVMMDAVQSWNLLNSSGLMIFDDYYWKFYGQKNMNPACAIDCFLRLKKDCYDILAVTSQVIIRKK